MLQSMRQIAHSWVVKGLMLVLVISFGIWGIGDMFRGNPLQRAVATVGTETITVQAMNRAFEQTLARARQMMGPDLTPQQAKQIGLANGTLNQLIENALLVQDLKRLGLNVSERMVLSKLAEQGQFKTKDGGFDKNLFRQALANARMSERQFFEQSSKEIALQEIAATLTNIPAAPHSVVDALYRARAQKRVFDIVSIDNAAMRDIPATDEKALRDYQQQNAQAFTAPEYRTITIASLTADSLAKDISVSDEDVRKEYDTQGDKLTPPETRNLLQVIVQDEAKAKSLSAAARATHNLASAAKANGATATPLNEIGDQDVFPEMAKIAFAMKTGEISDPIKTEMGWHVVEVKKINPSIKPDFVAVKEKMRDIMKRDQAIDSASKIVNKLDDMLAAGTPLEDIADTMKLRLIKIAGVDAMGKLADGKAPAELPYKDDVLKAAYGLQAGETSPVMDDKNGNYFVVRTDAITPSALKPFEQVKDEVVKAWKADQQSKLAEVEANRIAKALREGDKASSLAGKNGIAAHTSKPLLMTSADADERIPAQAMEALFTMKKGDVQIVPLTDKKLVIKLTQILPADDSADEASKNKISGEMNASLQKEISGQYLRYLRTVFPVKIHPDAFEGIAQQNGAL